MIRRLTLGFTVLAMVALFGSTARAGQDTGTWEFNPFGAKASLDSEDPLGKVKSLSGDVDADGTPSNGVFTRTTSLDDNLFMGFRLGYVWSPKFECEVIYDRNYTGGDYKHTIVDDSSGLVEETQGRMSAILTSYQIGGLYHPLGSWKTPWQPYVAVSVGYLDADFAPSDSIAPQVFGGLAGSFYKISFPKNSDSVLLGYGVGLKYFIVNNVAVRAEIRAKSYEVFSERRTDHEISLGISFFAPGVTF